MEGLETKAWVVMLPRRAEGVPPTPEARRAAETPPVRGESRHRAEDRARAALPWGGPEAEELTVTPIAVAWIKSAARGASATRAPSAKESRVRHVAARINPAVRKTPAVTEAVASAVSASRIRTTVATHSGPAT